MSGVGMSMDDFNLGGDPDWKTNEFDLEFGGVPQKSSAGQSGSDFSSFAMDEPTAAATTAAAAAAMAGFSKANAKKDDTSNSLLVRIRPSITSFCIPHASGGRPAQRVCAMDVLIGRLFLRLGEMPKLLMF